MALAAVQSGKENFQPGKIDCTISKPCATQAMQESSAASSMPGEGAAASPTMISGSILGSL